jgi:hypothetical protein
LPACPLGRGGDALISHLQGALARKNESASSVEVDVGGVWYEVELPAFVWRSLEDVPVGAPVEFETFYFVTANAPIPRLIGFRREVEREFFKKLIPSSSASRRSPAGSSPATRPRSAACRRSASARRRRSSPS